MTEARVVLVRAGPEKPWVGQLVRYDVQLWRPLGESAALPPFSFADPEMPGAIALFRPEVPPPEQRQEGETTYLVQHRTLLVFPQVDGALHVPSLRARWDEAEKPAQAESSPLAFTAAFPAGSSEGLLIAPRVTLMQTVDRELSGLRVGDGFTRSVVLRADDSDPIVLPELGFAAIDGLAVYPSAPLAASSAERGQLSASRTFTATYVVERVGHYEVPGLTLRWLEPESGRYHEAAAPALGFWARPNLGLGLSMWGTAPTSALVGFGTLLLLFLGVGGLVLRRFRGGPWAWERRWATRRAEARAFARLISAARHDDALAVLRASYVWLRARFDSSWNRTLVPLRSASQRSEEALTALEARAFDPTGSTAEPKDLVMTLEQARAGLAKSVQSGLPLGLQMSTKGSERS